MFLELKPILSAHTTLALSLSIGTEDKIRLTVTPIHHKDETGALHDNVAAVVNRPLILEGTAGELDAELAQALIKFRDTRAEAATTLSTFESEIEAAKKDADTRLAAEKKRGSSASGAKHIPGTASHAKAAAPKTTSPCDDGRATPGADPDAAATPAAPTPIATGLAALKAMARNALKPGSGANVAGQPALF